MQASDGSHSFYVDGGFAQMLDNTLTILTEQAQDASQIDTAEASQALKDAEAMTGTDPADLAARDKAVKRAKAKIKLASGS